MMENCVQRRQYVCNRLESEVGILLNIYNGNKCTGTFKDRFSDFHVNEIDPKGNIVRLTSFELPEARNQRDDGGEESKSSSVIDILPLEIQKEIEQLEVAVKDKAYNGSVDIDVTNLDKDDRTRIHRWINQFDKLSSETIDREDDNKQQNSVMKKIICVSKKSGKSNRRRPGTQAKFTHCVLYKEGLDTCEAIGFICKKLNLKPSLVGYAGNKDKQGKTSQRISIPNVQASRLLSLSKLSKGSKLGNFEYLPKPIRLGELSGNYFKILLKDVKLCDVQEQPSEKCDGEGQQQKIDLGAILKEAFRSLETLGFINYFGLQRFGTLAGFGTHSVGRALAQGKWVEAFDMILAPRKTVEHPSLTEAKEVWLKTRDAESSLKKLDPCVRTTETHLLHGLARFKTDYLGAFLRIPRNTRLLYVHAFQSYLWNKCASRRISTFGTRVRVGDLVACNSLRSSSSSGDLSKGVFNATIDEPLEFEIDNSMKTGSTLDVDHDESSCKIELVSKETIDHYSIFDVVLPLPGTQIDPTKCPGQEDFFSFYTELVKEEGVEIDWFNRILPRQDAPHGAYRRLVVRPGKLKYEIDMYSTGACLDSYLTSDYDLVLKQETAQVDSDTAIGPFVSKSEKSESDSENKKNLVVVEFSLPRSSYATMALREVFVFHQQGGQFKREKSMDQKDLMEGNSLSKRAKF